LKFTKISGRTLKIRTEWIISIAKIGLYKKHFNIGLKILEADI